MLRIQATSSPCCNVTSKPRFNIKDRQWNRSSFSFTSQDRATLGERKIVRFNSFPSACLMVLASQRNTATEDELVQMFLSTTACLDLDHDLTDDRCFCSMPSYITVHRCLVMIVSFNECCTRHCQEHASLSEEFIFSWLTTEDVHVSTRNCQCVIRRLCGRSLRVIEGRTSQKNASSERSLFIDGKKRRMTKQFLFIEEYIRVDGWILSWSLSVEKTVHPWTKAFLELPSLFA